MRDQDQRRPLAHEAADGLHEAMPGDEIEAGGRLVEDERIKRVTSARAISTRRRSPVDISLSGLPARWELRHAPVPRAPAHASPASRLMREHAVAAEEARDRSIETRHASARRAQAEGRIEVAGHDAETRAQLADVPVLAAEQPQRRHAVVGRTRPIVEGEQPNQRRLARAVRAEYAVCSPW